MSNPNIPDQATYWNETAGPRWVDLQEQLDRMLGPLGQRALEQAHPTFGERILDVGCGCGDTTLQLAEKAGSLGLVIGLDLSQVMLDRARQRAEEAGSRARFQESHPQLENLPVGAFDLVFSRFGVMFFHEPIEAFSNLNRALRSGGRLSFVCWRSPDDNPLFNLPLQAAAPLLTLPPPSAPDLPGPFSLAPPDRAVNLLDEAGFVQIQCDPLDQNVPLGSLSESVDFLLRMGPIVPVLAEADESTRQAVVENLRRMVQPYDTDQGVLLPTSTWLLQASVDSGF